jgi:hypothetical protein
MIQSDDEQEVIVTTTTLTQDVSIQQKQVDEIVEENMKRMRFFHMFNIALLAMTLFKVCLGFQPLAPIDIALLVASSPTESSHTQTKAYHAARSVEQIQHLQQVHDILPQEKYKQDIYFNKESDSPRFKFNRTFPHLPRELDTMGTISS